MTQMERRLDTLERMTAASDIEGLIQRIAAEDDLTPAETDELRENVQVGMRRYQGMSTRDIAEAIAAEEGWKVKELLSEARVIAERVGS